MKKNNKKHLPLLLLALLMISVGAYGTRAYFTDSATEDVGIKLTLGDLEIKSLSEQEWKYTGNNIHLNDYKGTIDLESSKDIKYVQPGDSFSRTFKFVNTGSLHQKVKITNGVRVGDQSPFVVSYAVKDGEGKEHTVTEIDALTKIETLVLDLAPKASIEATMIIKVRNDTNTDNNKYNTNSKNATNTNTEDFVLSLLGNSITVEAKQTNDDTPQPN